MKFFIFLILSAFTLPSLARSVPLTTRIEVLKTLAYAKTAVTDNEDYKISNLISDLDKALGGVAEAHTTYSIARLDCKDRGVEISCTILIGVENLVDGEVFESGVIIDATFIKLKNSKLQLRKNKVGVTIAG